MPLVPLAAGPVLGDVDPEEGSKGGLYARAGDLLDNEVDEAVLVRNYVLQREDPLSSRERSV